MLKSIQEMFLERKHVLNREVSSFPGREGSSAKVITDDSVSQGNV